MKEDEKKKMNQETKEPVFTNLSGGNSSTLDYIFHTGIPDIYLSCCRGSSFSPIRIHSMYDFAAKFALPQTV